MRFGAEPFPSSDKFHDANRLIGLIHQTNVYRLYTLRCYRLLTSAAVLKASGEHPMTGGM
jgi:hypothetical protein